MAKLFRHLGKVAAILEAHLRPAQDGAQDIVEIVRYSSRELADGLEFLRLAQLALHAAQFGDVLDDNFERFALVPSGNTPHVKPHGHDAAVGAPPLDFRAVNLAKFAALAHQLGVLFGEAEEVSAKIEILQALRVRAS